MILGYDREVLEASSRMANLGLLVAFDLPTSFFKSLQRLRSLLDPKIKPRDFARQFPIAAAYSKVGEIVTHQGNDNDTIAIAALWTYVLKMSAGLKFQILGNLVEHGHNLSY